MQLAVLIMAISVDLAPILPLFAMINTGEGG